MSQTVENYKAEILDLLQDSAIRTEKQLGAAAAKKRVRYADNSQKNFATRVTQTPQGFQTEFMYRNSLRFSDGGMGPGVRRQKLFLGRSIMRNINRVNDVVQGNTINAALQTTKILQDA